MVEHHCQSSSLSASSALLCLLCTLLSIRMIRKDLRSATQSRPLSIELGLITEADGSARVEMGNTKVVASVTGPTQPRYSRHELHDRACIDVEVDLSVKHNDTTDISQQKKKCEKYLKESLQSCIELHRFPRMLILFSVLVVNNDGAMLSVALNACVLALLDAGLPMNSVPNSISLCSMGIQNNDVEIILDPSVEEEDSALANYVFTLVPAANTGANSSTNSNVRNVTATNCGIVCSGCSGSITSANLQESLVVATQASMAVAATMRRCMEAKLAPAV